ncbi:MAG: nucleotidyltransferase [Ktedonobacter sp. 13_1_40CM_4_52_4]|nr:MAG: nucleotidyltransferase [Ktedonobacter sp. 13_1_40CM_4_52_4]
MRDISERLRDIQEAIARITKYTNQGREKFDQDELVQTWVVHHLEIIGEATRSIPQDFKDLHSEIAWKQIGRMRNILIHIYFGIDRDIVWEVVERDLPNLKTSIDAILNSEENS